MEDWWWIASGYVMSMRILFVNIILLIIVWWRCWLQVTPNITFYSQHQSLVTLSIFLLKARKIKIFSRLLHWLRRWLKMIRGKQYRIENNCECDFSELLLCQHCSLLFLNVLEDWTEYWQDSSNWINLYNELRILSQKQWHCVISLLVWTIYQYNLHQLTFCRYKKSLGIPRSIHPCSQWPHTWEVYCCCVNTCQY